MKKKDLVDAVYRAAGMDENLTKKDVQALIETTFDEIKKTIKKEDRFSFPGFGIFNKRHRAARTGRNPQTGGAIQISASTTVTFKPAQDLRNYMSGKK